MFRTRRRSATPECRTCQHLFWYIFLRQKQELSLGNIERSPRCFHRVTIHSFFQTHNSVTESFSRYLPRPLVLAATRQPQHSPKIGPSTYHTWWLHARKHVRRTPPPNPDHPMHTNDSCMCMLFHSTSASPVAVWTRASSASDVLIPIRQDAFGILKCLRPVLSSGSFGLHATSCAFHKTSNL